MSTRPKKAIQGLVEQEIDHQSLKILHYTNYIFGAEAFFGVVIGHW